VLGVDAGKSGACALLDDNSLLDIRDLPLDDDGELDGPLFFEWLCGWEPRLLVVEDCFRPKSLVTMCGEIRAVAKLAGVSRLVAAVVTWKKAVLGENTSDKKKSVAKCRSLFPSADLVRPGARTDNADRAEAVLLAHWGLQTRKSVRR
jgi:hypothetical protein